MGYRNPVWHNGMAPSINDDRLNDLCYTVERLDFADGRVVVGQKEGETLGAASTSEGYNTIASGTRSHAEGQGTTASGNSAHSEGYSTTASGGNSHSEGTRTTASGDCAHAEGAWSTASGNYSHSEGNGTNATGDYSHAENRNTIASGECSHAEGSNTTANGNGSHSEGNQTASIGRSSHAEGVGHLVSVATINGPINANETTYQVGTSAANGFRIGYAVKGTVGSNSYFASVVSKASESITLSASLNPDAALTSGDTLTIYKIEGVALTDGSHAEGLRTIASGPVSHSEGTNTISGGPSSHSEGAFTNSIGDYSHSEGNGTTASGSCAHSEGVNTTASGNDSHAEGRKTTAAGDCQHVFGQYNTPNTTDVEIVGWGTTSATKNIRTLDQSGNMTIAGTLTQSSDAKLKTVEGEIPDVSEIHAVRFRWNDVNGQHDDLEHVGYIAQDVEKVAPFMVKTDSNGYKALDYIAFLCAKMELLERRVKELEEKKG